MAFCVVGFRWQERQVWTDGKMQRGRTHHVSGEPTLVHQLWQVSPSNKILLFGLLLISDNCISKSEPSWSTKSRVSYELIAERSAILKLRYSNFSVTEQQWSRQTDRVVRALNLWTATEGYIRRLLLQMLYRVYVAKHHQKYILGEGRRKQLDNPYKGKLQETLVHWTPPKWFHQLQCICWDHLGFWYSENWSGLPILIAFYELKMLPVIYENTFNRAFACPAKLEVRSATR